MNLVKEWILPIVTISEMNRQEHWTYRYRRFKAQKKAIEFQFLMDKPIIKLPVLIKLTRYSPWLIDKKDNLQPAFKAIIDSISNQLIPGLPPGKADEDPRIEFEFFQEKVLKQKPKVKIEIYETN